MPDNQDKQTSTDKVQSTIQKNPGGGGARFTAPIHTGIVAHTVSCKMGTGSLARG